MRGKDESGKNKEMSDGRSDMLDAGEGAEQQCPPCSCRHLWKPAIVLVLVAIVVCILIGKRRSQEVPRGKSSVGQTVQFQQEATVKRSEQWMEVPEGQAADNPLDRALATGRPVVADFGRGICIPCKMMKPILDDLKEEYAGKAEILIVEIDQYPALMQRCGIRAIPTQIFYDETGKEVHRHQGFMPRKDIVSRLASMGVR